MTYRVRVRFVPSGSRARQRNRFAITTSYTASPFSTPDQRLFMAVRAIQRRYGQRIVVWRKPQNITKMTANRPL